MFQWKKQYLTKVWRQWEDHKIGKKHRKNVQKARRGNATSSSSAVGEEKEPTPDEVPAKKTAAWQWLEDGKAEKEAQKKKLWKSMVVKWTDHLDQPADGATKR